LVDTGLKTGAAIRVNEKFSDCRFDFELQAAEEPFRAS
jgi:hypothetical protein